jgi:hypothetical protein
LGLAGPAPVRGRLGRIRLALALLGRVAFIVAELFYVDQGAD